MASTLVKRYGKGTDSDATDTLVANTLKGHNGKGGSGISPEDTFIAAPLSHGSNPNSNMAGRRREDDTNLVAYALRKDPGGTGQGHNTNYVTAFHTTQDPIHHHHHQPALGHEGAGVAQGASVRRLTPTECERLQAFPDGWTDLGGTADSRRYAALGDAVTVTVAEWIGLRLRAALAPFVAEGTE